MDASVNRIPSSKDERSLLIAIKNREKDSDEVTYSLEELRLLVQTAGGIIAGTRIVNRDKIDPAFILGKGYLDELSIYLEENEIKLIVFDMNNIRPAQVRNLEEKLKCRVVGRNEVIMDIFARRAKSTESKIQVELAQLRYILPRLKGLGGVLSRLGGGIGTRGPGETMLETDRRHIQNRISKLSKKLEKYKSHRELTRKSRSGTFHGAVVGYTNAGKSTLINCMAKDDLFVENRLFATLDSYTRRVYLGDGKKTLLSDTVGFIRNLPANLIESFRSTLEEIKFADYIVHVIDISSTDLEGNIKTVEMELSEIDCVDTPQIMFFNKCDLIEDEGLFNTVRRLYPGCVIGSVLEENSIDNLKARISELLVEC